MDLIYGSQKVEKLCRLCLVATHSGPIYTIFTLYLILPELRAVHSLTKLVRFLYGGTVIHLILVVIFEMHKTRIKSGATLETFSDQLHQLEKYVFSIYLRSSGSVEPGFYLPYNNRGSGKKLNREAPFNIAKLIIESLNIS